MMRNFSEMFDARGGCWSFHTTKTQADMQRALLDPFIGSCKQDCWYLEQTAFEVSSLALKGIELFKNATRDVSASDTLPRERGSAPALQISS
jgi:hypothetical protein